MIVLLSQTASEMNVPNLCALFVAFHITSAHLSGLQTEEMIGGNVGIPAFRLPNFVRGMSRCQPESLAGRPVQHSSLAEQQQDPQHNHAQQQLFGQHQDDGSNFHNSACVLNFVQNQLQGIVCTLEKPDVTEGSTQLGTKIDSLLDVVGIDTFSEYARNITEKAKEDVLVNMVNSKVFALEISNFLRILCDSKSTGSKTERKFWWVQRRIMSNDDVEISIVSVEAESDTNTPGSQTIGTGTGSVELKIDVLEYGVPGELVRA